MEHKGSLLVALGGFGFVAFVLIKLASQIDTKPDLDHFKPPPTERPRQEEPPPRPPTPTTDLAEARRAADVTRSTMELLVDVAASQYEGRARAQLKGANPWVPADIPCELRSKGPHKSHRRRPAEHTGPDAVTWEGTFRCMDERFAYDVTFPVGLVFEGGLWRIDAETQAILSSEDRYLTISWRKVPEDEHKLALTPVPRPTAEFPWSKRS